jgi:ankyrin repeat protein
VKGASGKFTVALIFLLFLVMLVYIALWLFGAQPDQLRMAALRGENVTIDEIILKHPEWIDFPDKYGMTPLHQSMTTLNESTVKLLLDRGATVNATNHYGSTPLHLAAGATAIPVPQQKRVLELLILRGASLSARDRRGRTPLGAVHTNARNEIALWLRERGAQE